MKPTHTRRPVNSPEVRERLLTYIAAGDTLDDAAARVGVTRSAVARWRYTDPDFAAAYEGAFQASTDILEKEARARALDRKDRASAALLRYLITGRRERWWRLLQAEAATRQEEEMPVMNDLELAQRVAFILTQADLSEGPSNAGRAASAALGSAPIRARGRSCDR